MGAGVWSQVAVDLKPLADAGVECINLMHWALPLLYDWEAVVLSLKDCLENIKYKPEQGGAKPSAQSLVKGTTAVEGLDVAVMKTMSRPGCAGGKACHNSLREIANGKKNGIWKWSLGFSKFWSLSFNLVWETVWRRNLFRIFLERKWYVQTISTE